MYKLIFAIVILFFVIGCTQNLNHENKEEKRVEIYSNESVRNSIQVQYQKLKQAMSDGDASLIANNMYTKDCTLYNSSGDIKIGRDAVEQFFFETITAGYIIDCTAFEVEVSQDMAYEIGSASIQNKDGVEINNTRYMVIWKKENGIWKMYRDFVQGKG